MTNKALYNLETEWRLQEDADNGFYGWWREKYPTVVMYLNTPDGLGLCPTLPEVHDMQVILREWQKDHDAYETRITRVTNRGLTVIPEDTPEVRELKEKLEDVYHEYREYWEDVDTGRVSYSDADMDAFERKERSIMERLYSIGKRWL